ncbi:hypothetical protein FP828_03615 [bacterium]|nr:hypothetical protein [Candidatus Omnitrophota bacterium]MBA3065561.1 hypothetical protein [bacterium]
MAGIDTTNGYFRKPAYGTSGEAEKALFDAALDRADAEIASLKARLDGGEIRRLTTAQIQAICSGGDATKVRIFFNTSRGTEGTLEMWIGWSLAKPL